MDFGTLLFFGALWFLFNLLRRGGTSASTPGPSQPRPQPRPLPPSQVDPTQREGTRLEALLRDLNRGLEEAVRAKTNRSEDDESESREVVPEAISLETDVRRAERVPVAQDDLAEQIVARRTAAAKARTVGRTAADHREFDQRIRQEPADHTAVRVYTPQQLRDAVVWREILGPPVALRDE